MTPPPCWQTHLLRNGMSTKGWGEGEGVKGRSRPAGARSAALEALALTSDHRNALGLVESPLSPGHNRAAA